MWTALTLSSLLLGQAYGGLLGDVPLIQRDASTDAQMRGYVDSLIDPIDKRQSTTSTVNITQWNSNVLSSCTSTLQSLNGVASNPSGMAACYNIPFWDNSTGVFHADLRLFMISQPTGSFAGISAQDVQVDLSYASANVQSVDNAALRRRDDTISLLLYRDGLDKRQAPTLSQSYALYGELNQNVIGSDSYVTLPFPPAIRLTPHQHNPRKRHRAHRNPQRHQRARPNRQHHALHDGSRLPGRLLLNVPERRHASQRRDRTSANADPRRGTRTDVRAARGAYPDRADRGDSHGHVGAAVRLDGGVRHGLADAV
jgi:hypothetical protein